MDYEFLHMIDASILLELSVGKLYRVFADTFAEDKSFFRQLSLEENNHAALLRSLKDPTMPVDKYSIRSLTASMEDLNRTNAQLSSLVDRYRNAAPTRQEAFTLALEIERSIGEIHFQVFVVEKPKSQTHAVFQQLNKDDKDHSNRIQSYMEAHGIEGIRGKAFLERRTG